jgi:hypothetical protein
MPFSTRLLPEPVAVKPPYNGEYNCHIERPIFATSELALNQRLAPSPPSLKAIGPAHKFLAFLMRCNHKTELARQLVGIEPFQYALDTVRMTCTSARCWHVPFLQLGGDPAHRINRRGRSRASN